MDGTLSGVTTLGQSNGYDEVFRIPQSFKTGASPLNCLMSYPGHSLGGGSYPFVEMQ